MNKELLHALTEKHKEDCIEKIVKRVGDIILKFPRISREMIEEITRHMCESCLDSITLTIDTFEEVFREMDREHEHNRKSRMQR